MSARADMCKMHARVFFEVAADRAIEFGSSKLGRLTEFDRLAHSLGLLSIRAYEWGFDIEKSVVALV